MTQDGSSQIKIEARLLAIEYMIGHLHKMVYGLGGATAEQIAQSQAGFREQLKRETFSGPGIHPTQSDLAAGEVEEAFDNLLKIIAEMTGAADKSKG